jgi:hypothetical protein
MVGLVIEKVQKDICEYLRLWHPGGRFVTMQIGQRRFVVPIDHRN